MRQFINILAEAPRRAKAANPVDFAALLQQAQITSRKLAGPPFALKWEQSWAEALVQKLRQDRQTHSQDPDNTDVYDFTWNMWDFAERLYQHDQPFWRVGKEVEYLENEYQQRKGAAMDDAAGYESDSHFVESSLYLTGMTAQKRLAEMLRALTISPHALAPALTAMDGFVEQWGETMFGGGETDESPELCESLHDGLRKLLPFLVTILKIATR
jgi:hypothetical protein